jgi:dihydrofolate reductase
MAEFYRSIDTIVWGRKTYDFAVQVGQPFDAKKHNYVLSRRPPAAPVANVEFVTESVDIFAKRLRQAQGSNVWLMGGAELFASFLDVGGIDEFIIHVVPIFIGAGIPLLTPGHRTQPLKLVSSRSFADGVVRLQYAVGSGGLSKFDRSPPRERLQKRGGHSSKPSIEGEQLEPRLERPVPIVLLPPLDV